MGTKEKPQSNYVIKVKLDVVFKKLFSENKNLLHELLVGLLKIPKSSIKNINLRNSEILPDDINGKFVRMDLNMEVDDKLINVEMQLGYDSCYKDRSLLYWARLFNSTFKSGNDYSKLKQSICINIVDQKLFDCAEYHSHFTMLEKNRHTQLTDKCSIHFFELSKISRTIDKEDLTQLWLQLINAETEEELEMLEQTGVEPIQEAVVTIHKMSKDEKLREIARLRDKARSDEVTALRLAREEGVEKGMQKGMQKGRKEGLQEGRKEGLQEGRKETARRLLQEGLPAELVARATQLSMKEVRKLQKGTSYVSENTPEYKTENP